MPHDQTIGDLIARLERERLDADRLYNDALTAVDAALQAEPSLPAAPAEYDASRLPEINALWRILPEGPPPAERATSITEIKGIKARLRRLIWRMVGPSLEGQQRFNAALVDHLNRNADAHRETSLAIRGVVETLGRELRALVRFESLLIQSLQTITVYVDSKDRSLGGSELRERLALTEQRLLALKREVDRVGTSRSAHQAADHSAKADIVSSPDAALDDGADVFAGSVGSLTYVGFEDRFRGTEQAVRDRVEDYVPLVAQASDVVDIGCGRGELLALLGGRGVAVRGVDTNAAMVELCRSRGLDAQQGDALSFLDAEPDGGIGGLVAIQVVEHFAPAYLVRFLETAFHKMRPGAPLVLETINPSCWMAFFETYIRDPTHRQPIHPDTLKYLVQAAGFSHVDVQFRAPVPETDRLDRVGLPPGESLTPQLAGTLGSLAAAIDAHADKLNRLLFSSMDYVVTARR